MTEAMAGDARIKRADDRMNEFLSKTLEREDKKRKEKEDGEKKRRVEEEQEAQKAEDEDDKEMEAPAQAEQGGQMPGSSGGGEERGEAGGAEKRVLEESGLRETRVLQRLRGMQGGARRSRKNATFGGVQKEDDGGDGRGRED